MELKIKNATDRDFDPEARYVSVKLDNVKRFQRCAVITRYGQLQCFREYGLSGSNIHPQIKAFVESQGITTLADTVR